MTEQARESARSVRIFLLDDHEVVRRGVAALLCAEDDLEIVGEAGTAAEAEIDTAEYDERLATLR